MDPIPLLTSFGIASLVSAGPVVRSVRPAVGLRFAEVEGGIVQLLCSVLFGCAFFLEGSTGLAIAIRAIAALFVVMRLAGRVRWAGQLREPGGAAAISSSTV